MGTPRSDPELTDADLGGEIELLGALISLATHTDGSPTDEQVDAVLLGEVELPEVG